MSRFIINRIKKPSIYNFFLFLTVLLSCQNDSTSSGKESLVPTNLNKYGIPTSLTIPPNCSISESNYSHEKGLIITGNGFDMRVDAFQDLADSSHSAFVVKTIILEEKKTEDDFKRLIEEDSTGFVYETFDKELGANFHFFSVQIKDNVQIEFREGIPKENNFSLENIMKMYHSVHKNK